LDRLGEGPDTEHREVLGRILEAPRIPPVLLESGELLVRSDNNRVDPWKGPGPGRRQQLLEVADDRLERPVPTQLGGHRDTHQQIGPLQDVLVERGTFLSPSSAVRLYRAVVRHLISRPSSRRASVPPVSVASMPQRFPPPWCCVG